MYQLTIYNGSEFMRITFKDMIEVKNFLIRNNIARYNLRTL